MSLSKKRTAHTVAAAVVLSLCAFGLAAPASAAAVNKGDTADEVQAYERDVFEIVGSTLRNPDEATDPDAPLFNVAGVALELTWGQWQAATASSTMRHKGNHTNADLTLSGLVPGGVYSVFYLTIGPDSENALCPNVERALPLLSTDKRQRPDASSFVAGPDGAATFAGRIEGDPLSATQVFVEVIYHSDGQTYGPLPNGGESQTQGGNCRSSYGEDAMRQMLVIQKS